MFDKEKYISKGINEKLSADLITILWMMIDEAKDKTDLDYFQVFRLSVFCQDGIRVQKIIHKQEKPKYKYPICILGDTQPINAKIYCIDDNIGHSTMILAEEY